MNKIIAGFGILLAFMFSPTTLFAQAPPKSCASKFVGTWNHSAGFISNVATLTADGTAACSGNMFCVQGTWTCSGNSLSYNNGSSNTIYTLVNPNLMTGEGGRLQVTRIGAPPAQATADGRRRCTDLSDLPGHSKGSQACDANPNEAVREAKNFLAAARAAEQYCYYTDQMQAAGQYRNAADSFTKAGQTASARDAATRSQRASANADKCQQLQQAATRASPSKALSPTAPNGQSGASCSAALAYLSQQKVGVTAGYMKVQDDLRAQGCVVPSLRECLKDRLASRPDRPGC